MPHAQNFAFLGHKNVNISFFFHIVIIRHLARHSSGICIFFWGGAFDNLGAFGGMALWPPWIQLR